MTLITGLNLSDRLYIWADTRITFTKNWTHNDNIIKIAPICWEQYTTSTEEKKKNTILVAVAWNLWLTKYLYECISKAIQNWELSDDIRLLSDKIEEFSIKLYDNWLRQGNHYCTWCLLFGGTCINRRKEVDIKKIELLKAVIDDSPVPPDIENDMMNSPVAQMFKNKGIDLSSILHKPHIPQISPLIQKAINENSNLIDAPDSLIFWLTISEKWVKVQKAEWGEFIAYGTNGITQEHFSQDFLARMELPFGKAVDDLNETLHIRDEIIHIAKEHNIQGIGGVVTPAVIRNNNYKYCFAHNRNSIWINLLENVEQIYETPYWFFFRKWKKLPIKLIHFFEYDINNWNTLCDMEI